MYDFEADYDTEDKMVDKWSNRHRHALHSARHFFLASHLLENLLLRDFRILRRCLAKNMQTKSVLTEETIENIIMLWTFDSVRMSTTMKTDEKEALSAW